MSVEPPFCVREDVPPSTVIVPLVVAPPDVGHFGEPSVVTVAPDSTLKMPVVPPAVVFKRQEDCAQIPRGSVAERDIGRIAGSAPEGIESVPVVTLEPAPSTTSVPSPPRPPMSKMFKVKSAPDWMSMVVPRSMT